MELTKLSNVGKQKTLYLNELGIYSIEDLLHYYPRTVELKTYTSILETKILIKVVIKIVNKVYYRNRSLNFFSFKALYDEQILTFKVFNQPYLYHKLIINDMVSVLCTKYKNTYVVSKILFNNEVPYLEIKYRSNKNISSKQIMNLVSKALHNYLYLVQDNVDEQLISKYKLLSLQEAIYLIHQPKTYIDYQNALRTIKYHEAYNFMRYLQTTKQAKLQYDFTDFNFMANITFIKALPFALTLDQQQAIKAIYQDISHNFRINRLIHGEVGSGKTIISIITTHLFISNQQQVAILAPTEILAKQLYDSYCKYLAGGIFLSANVANQQTKQIYEDVLNNKYQFIVGTHALLNEQLQFAKLGLIIIDEQHRFGVEQRQKLINKQQNVNTILMSATPIPRTLGLILFDNVNLTAIKQLPSHRKPITTTYKQALDTELINEIHATLLKKQKIYVVAPAIATDNLVSVETLIAQYTKIFGKQYICSLHGQMDSAMKQAVFADFVQSQGKILISTTIIEVGIDISDANMIIIHQASRFGLATLHQLRGRVGRGATAGQCIVIDQTLTQRLELFINTTNGFEISEADFKLRGPGDLLGTYQSGHKMFKLLNIFYDIKIIKQAKLDVSQEGKYT